MVVDVSVMAAPRPLTFGPSPSGEEDERYREDDNEGDGQSLRVRNLLFGSSPRAYAVPVLGKAALASPRRKIRDAGGRPFSSGKPVRA